MKILSIVEATTINAVAKNVFEYHRAARELGEKTHAHPSIEGYLVTFERNSERPQSNEFVNEARKRGLKVEVIPERRRFDISAITALRKVIEREKPDIVVTHSVKSHFVLWRSQVWREYPWVAFHHGYTTTDLKMRVYNRLDRWSLPHARRIVTVCHAFARELASNTGVPVEQIAVQHNSVRPSTPPDAATVAALRTGLGIAIDERIVLSVGRLSKEKAHYDLLTAFKHLRLTHPNITVKLIIVGDGPERARLETTVKNYGLSENVFFAGQISDVGPYYAAADVFALPSHSEGSPNVVLEAMAASLPIVATAVGGVPEILEDNETALLVPVNGPVSMAEGIARILTEAELGERLTSESTALIAGRFNPEQYVRSLNEFYQSVIKPPQAAG